jgi:NAD(P)-dependent dehydrogenase (short-subunit alcohol dehydrogenase family)
MHDPLPARISASSPASYPSLQDRVVFISGGASGIGAAMVAAFAGQGARVGFIDIDAGGQHLAAQLNATAGSERVLFFPGDVTDVTVLQAAIEQTQAMQGPIKVLVNNAANDRRHALADVTPEFFDAAVAVNLKHQFFAAQAVAPGMAQLGGGSIINLGSTSWMIKAAGFPVYATCKAAVRGLTRALARDLGKQNIRVNALVPGWVMTDKQLAQWVTPESETEIDAAQCLPGRLQADDIARMALFLASDDSQMCTAQDFVVDAGWS